jgi:hypothetical protein
VTWSRLKPRSQGHGHEHTKARKLWAAQHHPADPCYRCGHPLGPMGPGLHLDHDDHDKRIYRGFSHGSPCPTCGVRCNLSAAGRLGRTRQQAERLGASRLQW